MTPTPPEGFKIIPREWLEAGNPLPGDALVSIDGGIWRGTNYRGKKHVPKDSGIIYATAQPLPCFQKGGDEPCATNIEANAPVIQSSQDTAIQDARNTVVASNAPVAVPSPDQGPEQARNNALSKLAYEQSGEPRTECPTCAGMNDVVATQGQRIAELEREIESVRHCGNEERRRLTKERDEARQTADAFSGLMMNCADTLRSRGIDASVGPLDIRVIELAKRADTLRAQLEKDREKCGRALRLWAKFFGPSHVVKCDEEDRLTVQRAHDEALAAIDAAIKEAK